MCLPSHGFFLWNERFKALDLVKTVFLCVKATSRVQTDSCKKVKVGKEKNQESWPCFLVRCDQGSISHFWPQPVKAKEERGTCSMKPMKSAILDVSLVACKITSTLKVDEHWVRMFIEKNVMKVAMIYWCQIQKLIMGDQNELGQKYEILTTANYQFEWAW